MNFCLRLILASLPLWTSTLAAKPGDFVSQETVQELEILFNSAQSIPAEKKQTLIKTAWHCNLYGVRSQMQVEKDLRLYSFSQNKNFLKNDGSQIIREYSFEGTELLGKNGDLHERLRLSAKGQLVGQMVFAIAPKSPRVIAYSVCSAG